MLDCTSLLCSANPHLLDLENASDQSLEHIKQQVAHWLSVRLDLPFYGHSRILRRFQRRQRHFLINLLMWPKVIHPFEAATRSEGLAVSHWHLILMRNLALGSGCSARLDQCLLVAQTIPWTKSCYFHLALALSMSLPPVFSAAPQ